MEVAPFQHLRWALESVSRSTRELVCHSHLYNAATVQVTGNSKINGQTAGILNQSCRVHDYVLQVRDLMVLLGMRPSLGEVEAMIKEIDIDGNGEVDFEEFIQVQIRRALAL